jgi:hypothetical protein
MTTLTNPFDVLVKMSRELVFARAVCRHLEYLDHPVVREFEAKLTEAMRRQFCGRRADPGRKQGA